MFADNMPQNWAIYQVNLRTLNSLATQEGFNNPVAVTMMETDARWLYNHLLERFDGLTFILTSNENGRANYSEVA